MSTLGMHRRPFEGRHLVVQVLVILSFLISVLLVSYSSLELLLYIYVEFSDDFTGMVLIILFIIFAVNLFIYIYIFFFVCFALQFNRLTSGTQSLQPFMSVLLMKDRNQFQNTQFPLGNPTIKRIMRVTSASNTLNKIAGDADVTYQHLSDVSKRRDNLSSSC